MEMAVNGEMTVAGGETERCGESTYKGGEDVEVHCTYNVSG